MKKNAPAGSNLKFSLTLANQITIFRIILIPVIVIFILERTYLWAAGLFVFSMMTDLLDGLVARIKNEQSEIGAFLDPMADKLLVTSTYLALTLQNQIDMWVFVVVFSRDLIIVMGWSVIFILTGSNKITPRILGKVTTAVQMLAGLGFILAIPDAYSRFLLWSLVLFTVGSVVDYLILGEKRLGQWHP